MSQSNTTMVAGGKGLSKEVMDGLEMLVDGEVADVCRQAEQILLQGGDSGGEVDLDPAVRQVVFALITLVRPNKSSFTLPFKKCNYEVIIEKWMTLCPKKNNKHKSCLFTSQTTIISIIIIKVPTTGERGIQGG